MQYFEGEAQILSRFRASVRDDLRTELLDRGVYEFETTYALIQDLDSARTNHTFKCHDYGASMSSSSLQPNRSSTQTPSYRNDIKGTNLEWDNRDKGSESSKVSSRTKCYKCQGCGHLAASCPSLVRITIIDRTHTEAIESALMDTSLREKILKLTKSPQVMMLVSIVLIKHHQLTYLLLDVCSHNQLKRMIGEKCHLPHIHQNWR